MLNIDINTIKEVGEFGSRAWSKACAEFGVRILESADLPSDLVWAFSEIYSSPPERLLTDDYQQSGYFFMVNKGKISGGTEITADCTDLPGFHVKMRWGYICNQSRTLYGFEGQKQRSEEEKILKQDMENYLGYSPDLGGIASSYWPQPIIDALSHGVEEGAGLHNIAAKSQMVSPEFAGMPVTEMGVPDFKKMSEEQKSKFIKLCDI